MKQLTDKQKKIALAVVGILLAIHFALPRFMSLFHPPTVHSAPAKPSPYQYAPAPAPPPPPPSPEVAAVTKYGGIWGGSELMEDQNRCGIKLEIRLSDDLPKKVKGYESKTCVPVQALAGGKGIRGQNISSIIRETSPVSAIMTGTPTDGGIKFTVDSTIGQPYDGCALVGMAVSGFGEGQLQAQWQSQSSMQMPCADNRMLLKKAKG